jgi:hypothetical protein
MKIIILAHESDNHAAPVKWALEQAGYLCVCCTAPHEASLLFDDEARIFLGPHLVEAGDSIWLREPREQLSNLQLPKDDRQSPELETRFFNDCITGTLDSLPVRCINKFSSSGFIRNKSAQLHLANQCGLHVPATLMSNSPGSVKEFFARDSGRNICKPFTPHMWQNENNAGTAVTGTFELSREQLPSDEVFTLAPGIYQRRIDKQFDVRTVLIGDRVYSHGLYHHQKALDWRHDASPATLEVRIIPTPPEVEEAILRFSKQADICFGSIDFAVDRNGRWWFLEINEQGQFLWLDQYNPGARLQEKFCAFLTAPDTTQPVEDREQLFPSFSDYLKSCDQSSQKQQSLDIAAMAPNSPHMSLEP